VQNKLEIDIVTIMITNDGAVNRWLYYNLRGPNLYLRESKILLCFSCTIATLSTLCLCFPLQESHSEYGVDFAMHILVVN
jgi:hypothetical protein